MSGKYSDYSKLPLMLKRIPFETKMAILFLNSEAVNKAWIMHAHEEMSTKPLPPVLEQICMLFVDGNEYGNDMLTSADFAEIYNTVHDQTSDYLRTHNNNHFAQIVLQELGLTQFPLQQQHEILRFRYAWLFSYHSEKIDMRKTYIEKFKIPYERFEMFAYVFDVFSLITDSQVKSMVYSYLLNIFFADCVSILKITREEYQKLNEEYSKNDIQNYAYCIRPSYTYAVIEWRGKKFLPLPHLITKNITSSFMYRLTEENNDLRGDIGKYVYEEYLYFLLNESGSYSEIHREIEYRKGTNRLTSPDVIARVGNNVILFESKSTVPRSAIRLLADTDIEKQVDLLSEHIKQLYSRMQEFDLYNPFKMKGQIDKLWGIVVIQEDSYTNREKMYLMAAKKLGISRDSYEFEWMVKHIRLAEIYDIERVHLFSGSILDSLLDISNENSFFDFNTWKATNSSPVSVYRRYKEKQEIWIESLCQDLVKKGILMNK